MRVIDDKGYVFGVINIIDVLVLLLVLALVVAGVAVITPERFTERQTQTITFRTTPQPDYVVEAIAVGLVPTENVVIVNDKTVRERGEGRYVAVLQVSLRVTMRENVPMFQGERLYVGRTLRLDFGTAIVDGTVIDMQPIGGKD